MSGCAPSRSLRRKKKKIYKSKGEVSEKRAEKMVNQRKEGKHLISRLDKFVKLNQPVYLWLKFGMRWADVATLSPGKTEIATGEGLLDSSWGGNGQAILGNLRASGKRHKHPGEAGSDGALGRGKSQVLEPSPA